MTYNRPYDRDRPTLKIRTTGEYMMIVHAGFGTFIRDCYKLAHMESEQAAMAALAQDAEVMASVEEGPTEQFIIADISRDDAYVSLPLSDAVSLPAWR